jgi:hypothetical protein
VTEVRKWDTAAAKVAREAPAPPADTRDTRLVMLAALCEQIRGWLQAEARASRAARAVTLADRVFDAYQTKQKADLAEILKRISQRVAQIYAALHRVRISTTR